MTDWEVIIIIENEPTLKDAKQALEDQFGISPMDVESIHEL